MEIEISKMKLNYRKEEEVQMVKFLRFRKEDPQSSKQTYMALSDIAKFLNKSTAYVGKICKGL